MGEFLEAENNSQILEPVFVISAGQLISIEDSS